MQVGRAAAAGVAAWLLVAIAAENGRSEPKPAPIVVAQASAAEIEFWRSVESSKDPAEFEAYLKAYPTGQFAPLANIRLKKLRNEGQPGTAAGASKPVEPPQDAAARSSATADTNIPPAPPHKMQGMIGIPGRDISMERARELGLAAASGVEIEKVLPYTPAARANLKPGDVVISFDGEAVADVAHLVRLSRSRTPGSLIELQILRGGARNFVSVTLADAFESIWTGAHRGDPSGMLSLGWAYSNGELVDRDHAQANVWIRRAADTGNIVAMHFLGLRYKNGIGFERSESEAVRWYGKTADAIRSARDPAELEAYLKSYPAGQFTSLANTQLNKLRGEGPREAAAGASKPAGPPQAVVTRSPTTQDANTPPVPQHRPQSYIGVRVRHIDAKRARDFGLTEASGVEIESVTAGGPAANSGLEPRDVVLSIDGEPMVDQVDRGSLAHSRLARSIAERTPGQNAEFLILRNRERRTLNVVVGDYVEQVWRAAHLGVPGAMHNLGSLLARGELVDRDPAQANVWFRRAADAGNVRSMWTLGWRYAGGHGFQQDDREAVRWYRKAADAGHAEGMFSLGAHYDQGRGVERDSAEAARWWKMAGEKGYSGGLVLYGRALMFGNGVAKNESLAVDYLRRAAKLNNSLSFGPLGHAYYLGRGVEKDHRQAADWYRRAADRNIPDGSSGLGMMYERGQGGLAKNQTEAIKHYRKAAEAGNPYATERLKALKASIHDPAEVQKLLAALGFDPGPRPGPKTADAIRKFQQSRGLPVDGAASLRLVGQLRAAIKQKTAAAGANTAAPAPAQDRAAPSANASSTGGADLDALMNLEKLD